MRDSALKIWKAGVEAAKPKVAIGSTIKRDGDEIYIDNRLVTSKKVYIFGAGKASFLMAKEACEILGDKVAGGVVISNKAGSLERVTVLEGSHPVLDNKTVEATKRLIDEIQKCESADEIIFMLSGGASALLEQGAVSLEDMQLSFKALLASGASIGEINTIRKHISLVKGGQLAKLIRSKTTVLVISDVIGDDLEAIGSAPLYMDRSSFSDALNIIDKYEIALPKSVIDYLNAGNNETPKKPSDLITHKIIGSNQNSLKAMQKCASDLGFNPVVFGGAIEGEAKDVAKVLLGIARCGEFARPTAILFGGESTVTLKGNGKGGRNQEMVLSALINMKSDDAICFLAAGSDGIDGNSHNAGAVIDSEALSKAKELDLHSYLANNDSQSVLDLIGANILTGVTGTNVMDLGVILIKE